MKVNVKTFSVLSLKTHLCYYNKRNIISNSLYSCYPIYLFEWFVCSVGFLKIYLLAVFNNGTDTFKLIQNLKIESNTWDRTWTMR